MPVSERSWERFAHPADDSGTLAHRSSAASRLKEGAGAQKHQDRRQKTCLRHGFRICSMIRSSKTTESEIGNLERDVF